MGKTLKKFLQNKNTVTILGVLIAVGVLYFSYNYRVKKAIEPVSVPIAKVAIGATEEITADKIDYVKVSSNLISKSPNIIQSADQLIGNRVMAGASIPVNGLFYTGQVVSPEELPDAAFANIEDGYTIYSLKVDNEATLGNSIYPGSYIDIYLKTDDGDRLIYGKLIKSIKVLDVKDANGNHVFKNGVQESGTAAEELLFAVPDDLYMLLKKAELIETTHIDLIPVLRNDHYTAEAGETEIESEYLKNFILSKTQSLSE